MGTGFGSLAKYSLDDFVGVQALAVVADLVGYCPVALKL